MNALIVFLGGGLGALVRYFLYMILPKNCELPCGTMMANFFGCFIAAAVFTYFVTKCGSYNAHPHCKILLITGFCGGLSTLSALSIEVMQFVQQGSYLKATSYILLSLLICTISVILGVILVKKYV